MIVIPNLVWLRLASPWTLCGWAWSEERELLNMFLLWNFFVLYLWLALLLVAILCPDARASRKNLGHLAKMSLVFNVIQNEYTLRDPQLKKDNIREGFTDATLQISTWSTQVVQISARHRNRKPCNPVRIAQERSPSLARDKVTLTLSFYPLLMKGKARVTDFHIKRGRRVMK